MIDTLSFTVHYRKTIQLHYKKTPVCQNARFISFIKIQFQIRKEKMTFSIIETELFS